MPYSSQHKEQTRQRILQAAAKLFCSHGFDRVTLTQIMKQANMTHGAFYAHFSGKSSLYEAAMQFATSHAFWARDDKQTEGKETHIKALVTRYLSWSKSDKEHPSPLEFLVTDAAHKEEKVRQAYQACFDSLVDRLAGILKKRGSQEAKALAEETVVSLVGTVAIARSFAQPLQNDFLKRAKVRIVSRLNSGLKNAT
ncbi:TetR/AcrR family transcriptional regulator [Marinomonas transparens]|uniref:TetR/AcrR family transcriptional regulator n=1 Tax=Marinomonas transparens TaxID=2795388 RepID=A0A934N158_9GAMM|nr:TetR/AcrR family transcriptional regulator [Marinomonas transparens]MBJ7536348.1 TetR/AcrR family transcriptional regulator [Marinomonas transparens]